jgi:hypothetical protein
MQVDYSKPLTPQEKSYLEMRGDYAALERAQLLTGGEGVELGAGDGTGLQQLSLMTSEQRATEADRLRARLAEIEGTDGADDSEVVEGDPYEVWSVDDLKAEIDRRNAEEGRTTKLSKAGGKQDLADRLYEDDEKAAQQQA